VNAAQDFLHSLPAGESPAGIQLAFDSQTLEHPDAYRLIVTEDRIELLGGSPAGCFHGLQTLRQLAGAASEQERKNQTGSVLIPCCLIEDRPDFSTRGLLHDVTRGKVPKLDTLKLLVDRLAALKVNQLQLYIEHAFVFSFDRDICDADHGLTPDEIRELHRYCYDRFITLVPAVATFGHMGRILSLPKFRHLAEVEATQPWEQMSWPQRARGFTLDCLNPESHTLVERIWTDILDAFPAIIVNICGDEPWDLGAGKNRDRLRGPDKGRAYVDHIERTHRFCAARGRRTQFWSDILRNHADLICPALRESTLLHWGYDDRADYEGTRQFLEKGMDTFVCPGTSGWKRIVNAMGLAERNIAMFAATGKRLGADGLLNTDWGDHGHFNALACSWHGIALGACCAWNAKQPIGREFDQAIGRVIPGLSDSNLALLREVSIAVEPTETWRLFWQPLDTIRTDPTLPSLDAAARLQSAAAEAKGRFAPVEASLPHTRTDLNELASACRFCELLAEKIVFARSASAQNSKEKSARQSWTEAVLGEAAAFASYGSVRYKPSGLADIQRALETVADDALRGNRS